MKIKTVHPNNVGWFEIKLDEIHIKHLWDCIKNPVSNHKPKLAGNVSKSQLIVDKNNFFFDKVLLPACYKYVEDFKRLPVKQLPISERHEIYLSSMWVNYQKQNEFNPSHRHTGVWSFVIWMKIPYGHEDQNKNNVTNFPCKGDFQFQYSNILGQTRSFKYTLDKSWEGHMVIFPSQLIHQVYPFYNCDEERISVSGNILVNTSKRL